MAATSRFVLLTDEQVKEFSKNFENDLKVLKEIEEELQEIIKKFVLAVQKKNGEDNEPSSMRAFIQSTKPSGDAPRKGYFSEMKSPHIESLTPFISEYFSMIPHSDK